MLSLESEFTVSCRFRANEDEVDNEEDEATNRDCENADTSVECNNIIPRSSSVEVVVIMLLVVVEREDIIFALARSDLFVTSLHVTVRKVLRSTRSTVRTIGTSRPPPKTWNQRNDDVTGGEFEVNVVI
jgi:hypothetical protein